jgi:predicted membrane-bound spermidine synthase
MMNDNTLFGITIDRHISIGHIFTTVALVVTSVLAYANMVNRIYNLEQSDIRTEEVIRVMQSDYQRTLDKIFVKLERIDEKIDRKADK